MNGKMRATAIFTALLLGIGDAVAGEWDLTGLAGVESRGFRDAGRFPGQTGTTASSAIARTEVYWRGEGGARFGAVVFGRADAMDDERTHADLRQASFGFIGDGWDVNLGVDKVFWGVTESRHLVDVINQTDLVEDIDEEDKLGQPMLNLNLERDFGRIELYVLPRFRERSFPGSDGRLRGPVPIDAGAALFESSDGKRHTDLSIRYSHYFGHLDVGVYVFDGTSREPRFEPGKNGTSLVPVYDQMRQAGIDLQLTRAAWLLKLEAIARETGTDDFTAAVAGIEYTIFGARGSAADVGLIVEYLYDGRSETAPPTAFDHDAFFGARLAFNDSGDTSVLAGAVLDIDTHETFVNVEAERRIGDRLRLEGRLRAFSNAKPGTAAYAFSSDDYLELGLSWYY